MVGQRIISKIILTVLVLSISVIHLGDGCSCIGNVHNQNRFCGSSYVIRGKALRNVTVTEDISLPGSDPFLETLIKYTVKVIEAFKGNGIAAGDEIEILTRTNSAACGVFLSTQTEYILGGYTEGGKYRIGLCNWVGQWTYVDNCVKSFLGSSDVAAIYQKRLYRNNCNCEVKFCNDLDLKCIDNESAKKNVCVVIGNGQPRHNSVCSKKIIGYTNRCNWEECSQA